MVVTMTWDRETGVEGLRNTWNGERAYTVGVALLVLVHISTISPHCAATKQGVRLSELYAQQRGSSAEALKQHTALRCTAVHTRTRNNTNPAQSQVTCEPCP